MDISMCAKSGIMMPPSVSKGIVHFPVKCKWEIEVRDRQGKVVEYRTGPSRSFLRNKGRFVRNFLMVTSTTNEDLTDTAGVAHQPRIIGGGLTGSNEPVVAAVGQMKFGNSNAAVLSTQFELQGALLGLVTVGNVTTTILTEDSTQSQWKHEGQVTNTTGGSFTVEEIGLYSNLRRATANTQTDQTMMMRDLTGSVIVADTLTILGRYTFTVAV